MRLLAFSDLHRDRRKAERLVAMAEDVDVVVGAGDFATMHQGLESTIRTLSPIAVPAVLVPGNAETDIELWQACASWPSVHVLHGQAKEIAGARFFGLGGGVPATPFPWSFDLSEDEAAAKLESVGGRDPIPQSWWCTHRPRGTWTRPTGATWAARRCWPRLSASNRRSSCAAISISAVDGR
jgi:Icc-related predicted phosphoesterase